MKTIFASLVILATLCAFAIQSPILLQRSLNRVYHDCANHVLLTSDGSYLVTGWAVSQNRSYDGFVAKFFRDGRILFEKLLGSRYDDEFSVALEIDGHYFLGGTTFSIESNYDAWIVKLDRNGQKVLEKSFGGRKRDEILAGTVCFDGTLLFVGRTSSFGSGETDVYVIKVDQDLNLIWQKTFGGSSLDEAYAVLEVEDGYLVVGFSESFSEDEDVYVLKMDLDGNKIFERIYGYPFLQKAFDVVQLADGFLMVGVNWNEQADDADGLIMKIDFSGNLIWLKTIGTKGWEQFNKVLEQNDEFILIGFAKNEFTKEEDVYAVRIDEKGNVLSEFYSNIENPDGCKYAIMSDNELIIVGWIDNSDPFKWDVLLLKVDIRN
ncbi:hypothetical protein [Pseudothermotoga thermarum]|uniref:Uncharacterized protein n=1 Tax=Pseudothermotoga thermarum DSM 5069 TaxID=688269 RepID=F7YTF0_9THEM|nr:hypothetical protein [Pseudothermotoga thermarum]AEH50128.1 hypothetical protein Theth_0020 [Pseudothermotoga thermarum DSM 5069]